MARLVTPEVRRRVAEVLRRNHAAAAAAIGGKSSATKLDWRAAVGLGLVEDASPGLVAPVFAAGTAIAASGSPGYDLGMAHFADRPIPQTREERLSAEIASARAAQYVVGLGNRVEEATGKMLVEADAALDRRLRGIMRDVVAARFGDEDASARLKEIGAEEGLTDDFLDGQFRSTVSRMTSDMGHLTKDWTRDLQRIAQTEFQNTVQEGKAARWQESAPQGRRQRVYKLPRATACPHCIRLYLSGGVPRIFYLDDLTDNGTNVGRKQADWQAVVGTMHPWCACSMLRVPDMLRFPEDWRSGQAVPTVIGVAGRLVRRKK